MIKKFSEYNLIKEDENSSSEINNDFDDLKEVIRTLITDSLNSTDNDVFDKFIKSYLEEDSESIIEGLVNDSDVYEFYLKYTESIDELLNSIEFFNKSVKEHGLVSLYDYMILGARKAVKTIVNKLK